MCLIHIYRLAKMISSKQIKAARALLDWTQSELADVSGLHLNAINKIENDTGEARLSSLSAIKAACENAGIKFRGQKGVELREDVFETIRIEGKEFLSRMIDDILISFQHKEDQLLCCNPDEKMFNSFDPAQAERYYSRMKHVGFNERVLTCAGYKAFAHHSENYRWLSPDILGKIAYTVYQDRVAFTNWNLRETLIIRNKPLSETFRGQFEFLWTNANRF